MPYPLKKQTLLLLLAICVSVAGIAGAGVKGADGRLDEIDIRTSITDIRVNPLETFGQRLVLYNNSRTASNFKINIIPNRYFRLVTSLRDKISIWPADSVVVGLKFLNVAAKVNGVYNINIELENLADSLDKRLFSFQVSVVNGIDQRLFVQPLQEQVLITGNATDFKVPVRFKNMLDEPMKVQLEVQNQGNGQFMLDKTFSQNITLPGKDTVIPVRFMSAEQLQNLVLQSKTLTVLVKNEKGDIINMFSFSPRWLASRGTAFYPEDQIKNGNSFLVEAYYSKYAGNNYSNIFRAYKPIVSANDHIGFGINYQRFYPFKFEQLTDTYLQLQYEDAAARIGTINDNHELSLFGRGVKGEIYFDEDHKTKMEAWGVDQNYNLLTPFSTKAGTQIGSVRYTDKGEDGNHAFTASSSFFQRSDIKNKGQLHFAEYGFKLGQKQTISIMAAGSTEKFSYSNKDTSMLGYAAKLNYSYLGEKLQVLFSGYRASRDYAGAMQGALNINGNVYYNVSREFQLSYQDITFISNRQNYHPDTIMGRSYFSSINRQLSFNFIKKNRTFYIRPYYFKQEQQFTDSASALNPSVATSARLTIGMNMSLSNAYIDVSVDAGKTNFKNMPNGDATGVNSYRLNASISYKDFSLNALLQKGPYFINEISYSKTPADDYTNYNVNLAWHKQLFNRVFLNTAVTSMYSNNIASWSHNIMQNVSVDMGKGFTLKGMGLYQRSQWGGQLQYQLGIQKRFDLSDKDDRKVRLSLRVFEDKNNSQNRDKDENWLKGMLIKVDEMILVTDKDGNIRINNLKKGWHTISMIYGSNTQQNVIKKDIYVDGNTQMDFGVAPPFELKGRVNLVKSKYLGQEESLEGIKISIRSGSREFITYTDHDGSFRMQLPAGAYSVAIDQLKNSGQPGTIKEVKIDPVTGIPAPVELTWVSMAKKVEVKKL